LNRIKQICSLIMLLLAVSLSTFSQERNAPVDENNLYYQALLVILDQAPKSPPPYTHDALSGLYVYDDYYHATVEASSEITDKLPAQVGEHSVEYLGYQGLVDRCRKLRKQFLVLVIHPMRNNGGHLEIGITFHWMSFKKKSLNYALEGGSTVTFRYDCEKHAFVIDSVESSSI
jgi:hypothetical protein